MRQNYYSKSIIQKSLKRASIVKLNDEELFVLKGMIRNSDFEDFSFIKELMGTYKIEYLCVIRGKDGADLYTQNELHTFVPGDVPEYTSDLNFNIGCIEQITREEG